jgi:sugar/nucleoside kinase (ribokinase family)
MADVPMHVVPAEVSTTFENRYTDSGRVQTLHGVAARLGREAVPREWRRPRIAHLGPVMDEVDPELAALFAAAFVGVTPQGWMRAPGEGGIVTRCRWEPPGVVAARADAVVFSVEDARFEESEVLRLVREFRIAVVTDGPRGARIFERGKELAHVPAPSWEDVDPTGAGDIFAAVLFLRLAAGAGVLEAAREASRIAADSVRREGLRATELSER